VTQWSRESREQSCGRPYRGDVSRHATAPVDASGATSVDEALALLRAAGGRVTPSRRLLVQALFDTHGHHSAEELALAVQARAPDVHLSTIYRNLEELERLGVIVHAHLGHGPATYHLTSVAHGHFVCEGCGATIEAPDQVFRGLARTARAEFGFTIDPHHFAVLGRCAACS
jgi:Fe2+ or Zn2+ uptake regulation protein